MPARGHHRGMRSEGKVHLKDMTLPELETFISSLGKEKYRARQLMRWMYQAGVLQFSEMTDLARDVREHLSAIATLEDPHVVRVKAAHDGTKKLLFRLEDGLLIEGVLIPGRNHWTACLSTQVGCRMGCRFCLTGAQGFQRNLHAGEITGQLLAMKRQTEEGRKVRNVVLMGMGEPLDNYEATVKAIKNLTEDHGFGLSNRRITVSTCGLVPEILRLGEDVCVNLAVSLNASNDQVRSDIMPINKRYPITKLLEACRNYPMPGRRMITFEYILMADVNDSPAQAEELARLLKGIRCKLNLIAFNEYPGSPFHTPQREKIRRFQQILLDHHYTAILRASHGSEILAACGQLSGSMANYE
ncbi:MAG: 23S rRNA (adenine(2503)-C(2))-methyltransferase RlmN [Syntrophales bacterium]|nr:23S rRNA (adenine(2503)-C(2))-methyltransferase RlmN [Syntrophales bacterium]